MESNMGEGGGAVVPPEVKRRRKRVARKPAPEAKGRKTLIAAAVGAALAVVDLWLTVKLGIKLPGF